MIEALRGLGYSTATALADIVDNSIAANASNVAIQFLWDGSKSRVSVQDDGCGMNAAIIDKAMRLGDRNPLEERAAGDLGRFGLGLKTASFSQCRRLTVASTGEDGFHCLRWDLDVLATSEGDGWYLLEGPAPGSEAFLESARVSRLGTLVLWEELDRIVTADFAEQDFLDLIDRVESHLSMVFHRYLEGTRPVLRLTINGKRLQPWDPFLVGHPAKPWHSPTSYPPRASGVEAECHVLPHRDRLTAKEYESAQGPDGWTAQQGFYVYRNRRLLVAGSWLGLGQGRSWTKDEAHRLARIRLDIPNSADADWKIDIRKSTARPPVALRPWLIQLADATRSRARRAFAHRGRNPRTLDNKPVGQAWRSEHFAGGMRYRVDLDHPAIRCILDDAGTLLPQIKAMLRVLEETIPVQRIWLDTAESREIPRTGFDGASQEEVADVLRVLYRTMVEHKGMSEELARERLLHTEPFCNYPQLIAGLA
ncbi:ATP-binding protein [Cupriavidus pinatubonensis]|uniref:MZA anti-phage system associated ATPase MzaB n=1 Tax=Cupriavidus pinatubonensis TaxID=248026 RepID=UPI001C739465|nr:MZA anti-phage system associated ATPase MzaB [Cupriavidus pinatubonensis]QYY31649.1 ATP-binding protein [Cupriavidus pinatubonensis]